MSLYQAWLNAKHTEETAVKVRRDLEDQMVKDFNVSETLDGTKNITTSDGYLIKVIGRMTRKVNAEKLQELAEEHGLSDHLSSLFRWKPEINSEQWAAADSSITTPLLDAITTTAGRPTFKITIKE
jgi:hypothetical protein